MQFKTKFGILITLTFLTLSYQANAVSLLVEPYLGYAFANQDDNDGDTTDEWKHRGSGYGLRVGATAEKIMLGIVFDGGKSDTENKADPSLKSETTFNNFGVFLGFNGDLLRAWFSYYMSSKLTYGEFTGTNSIIWNANLKDAEYEGDGIGVGIGVRPLPWLNIFAEVHAYNYDTVTNAAGVESNAGDAGTAYWLIGVSFPLTFF